MAIQYRSGTPYRSSVHYDGLTPQLTTQQVSMRARISHVTAQTFTAKANIIRIFYRTQVISLQGRIAHQQGWPIIDSSDPGFSLWQDTRLALRARILHYIAFPTQGLRMKGRVTYGKTLNLQFKARIVNSGRLSMRANILPRFFTTSVRMQFEVRRTSQARLRVVFYVPGAVQNWSLGMKARIVKTQTTRMTGHFVVAMPVVFDKVLSVGNPTTLSGTQQTLTIRARITR